MTHHLTIDQFANLRIDPNSANDIELDHLVDCSMCRVKIATIDRYFEMNALCLDSNSIKSPEVSGGQGIKAAELIEKNAPINYTFIKSIDASQLFVSEGSVSTVVNIKKNSKLKPKFSVPVWSVAASIFLSVIVGFWVADSQPDKYFIATYQDSAGVLITQPSVGIGFFDEKSEQHFNVSDVTLVPSKTDSIIMKWPDFAKSKQYQVIIREQNIGILVDKFVSGGQINLPQSQFLANKNYQWRILASTPDKIQYELNGGFILR